MMFWHNIGGVMIVKVMLDWLEKICVDLTIKKQQQKLNEVSKKLQSDLFALLNSKCDVHSGSMIHLQPQLSLS
jgi:hypothetical protein